MEIKKLNPALIEKIGDVFTINTLTQCVVELVLNSLDANSTAIAVRLDPITLKVQVVDNGDGISRDSMDLLGQRFCTSKYGDSGELGSHVEIHGYRGQALADISERSRSIIVLSRRRNSSHTYSKTIGRSSGGDVRPARERVGPGTTVTVDGFFYCFPVRKRRLAAEVVLGDTKRYLEELLLMHPTVWFTLRNEATHELILDCPKHDDIVSRLRHLYPDVFEVDFSLLKVSKDSTVVEALMCKELSKHKGLQYFYLNKRPVHSTKLLKFVTDLFLSKKNRQGEKGHPVFAININCSFAEADLLFKSANITDQFKPGNVVMRCLEKLVCTLFDENTSREVTKRRALSECDISNIAGALKLKTFKKDIGNDPSPWKKKVKVDLAKLVKWPGKQRRSVMPDQQNALEILHDEKSGKGVIMEMFIKSTQAFNGEESDETVFEEESNVRFEKSVTEMKKSASILMNVKSTRKLKKKHVKLLSAAVQTSFDVMDTKRPDEDFTVILDNDRMTFVPKDPTVAMTTLQCHCRCRKDYQNFVSSALLPSKSPLHADLTDAMRCSHFQQPYQTNYYRDCNRNCCLQHIDQCCAPNFPNLSCENWHNIPPRYLNLCCEQENTCNSVQRFNPPQDELVRFMECRNLNCGHKPRSTEFMNDHDLSCGCMARNVNLAKNLRPHLPRHTNQCGLGYIRYINNDDSCYKHQDVYMTQNIPQPSAPRHGPSHTNLEEIIPNLRNSPGFESNRRNNAVDLLETSEDLTRIHREDIPIFNCNFSSGQKDQNDEHFNTNFPNTHRDQLIACNSQEVLHSNTMNGNNCENNITEFPGRFLSTCKSQENCAEFDTNYSNQSQEAVIDPIIDANDEGNITDFTAKFLSTRKCQDDITDFMNTNMDHDKITEFNMKLLSPIKSQKDIDDEDNQEKCTMTVDDSNEKRKEVVRSKQSKLPKNWQRRQNDQGESFYVNTKTGFTLFRTPHLTQNQFQYEERLDLVPKGMSPILKEVTVKETLSQNTKKVLTDYIIDIHKYELPFVKWQKYLDDIDPERFFEIIYMEKVKMFQSFVPKCNDFDVLNDVVTFDKSLFDNFEVIGQVDRKFLAVISSGENVLVLFDQHAVHERIRLESLLKVYKNATSVLREPLLIEMKPDEVSLLQNFENYLNSLGIYADFIKNTAKVKKVPLCLAKKIKTDPNHSLSNLMEYALREICESLRLTRGVPSSTLPQFIQGVISTEACRGAIKFGDIVSRKDCGRLLRELSKCDLPFQCAHGRPTVVPLVRLQSRMVAHKPNLKNLKLH